MRALKEENCCKSLANATGSVGFERIVQGLGEDADVPRFPEAEDFVRDAEGFRAVRGPAAQSVARRTARGVRGEARKGIHDDPCPLEVGEYPGPCTASVDHAR